MVLLDKPAVVRYSSAWSTGVSAPLLALSQATLIVRLENRTARKKKPTPANALTEPPLWTAMAKQPPTLILESALYVDDLDAAEAFYSGVIGLEWIGSVPGRHVFFRCGAGVLLIFNPDATALANPGSPLALLHGARGPGHLCFAAEPLGLQAWQERLEAESVTIEAKITGPSGGQCIYFRDPAGNLLEFAEARIWRVT